MVRTNRLPWPCTRKTRLSAPNIIFYRPDESVKFGHFITNVIKFGTETSVATVADKVEWFNELLRRMIEDGVQSETVLPRIIFLYDRQTEVSLEEVRRAV